MSFWGRIATLGVAIRPQKRFTRTVAPVIVSAPASSANLGPGFDALAVALDLLFELAVGEPTTVELEAGERPWLVCEPTHPAAVAFGAGGGNTSTDLWWRSAIPPGRGLGFSGAARVAGAVAGLLGVASGPHVITEVLRHRAFEVAAELEDHPDNAAASAFGGFVVAAGGHVIRVPSPLEVRFVVWSPDQETSTAKSRSTLPDMVPFDDAVFNVGRASLLVAAIVAGDEASLRSATEDRLHQDRRLERVPQSRAAFDAMSAAGALAVWLSGSGPTIAGAVRPDDVDSVVSRLGATVPGEGRTQVLEVAPAGVRCRS